MKRIRSLQLLLLATSCLALGACSDADWENATSYLPLEQGQKSAPEAVQADAAAPLPPSAVVETTRPIAPAPTAPLTQPASTPFPVEAAQDRPAVTQSLAPLASSAAIVTASASEPVINEHCRAVATQRATDGQYMGMDDEAQRQEYERTYADCAAWDAAHHYQP